METMPLEHMITNVEDAVIAAGVHVPDALLGTTSTPRKHNSARIARESTINLDEFRNQRFSRVEDIIAIELAFEISPKDQRAGRNAAYVTSRAVRNAVTDLADVQQRRNGQTHLDSTELVQGEWLLITDRYRFRRYEEVGRG